MTDYASKEWLHQKYTVEGLGAYEIGELVDRDPKTIYYWLLKHGIPTRPRGHDARQHFKKGSQTRKGIRHTPETIEKVRQATIRDGRVPYLRNGQHWLKGMPREANPSWKGGITPERQAFYRSDEWKSAFATVWTRDDGKCKRCGLDSKDFERPGRKFHVHHIVKIENKELRADPSNLVLLCSKCHRFVHGKQNVSREFLGPKPEVA